MLSQRVLTVVAFAQTAPTMLAMARMLGRRPGQIKMPRPDAYVLLAAGGCAVGRGPLKLPDPIPLISPSPGLAVVYLLRVPREPFDLLIQLNGARVAVLTKETFTAIALAPGTYDLLAVHPNPALPSAVGKLTVAAGERRFLYSSTPTRGSVGTGFVPIAGGIAPVFMSSQAATGARRWTEMNEFDAQGMLSVLKPMGAEVHAP